MPVHVIPAGSDIVPARAAVRDLPELTALARAACGDPFSSTEYESIRHRLGTT